MRRSCGATIPTVVRRAVGLRSILIVAVMHRTTCANVPATRPPISREIAIEMSFVRCIVIATESVSFAGSER
jgi:hypothetical protein